MQYQLSPLSSTWQIHTKLKYLPEFYSEHLIFPFPSMHHVENLHQQITFQ